MRTTTLCMLLALLLAPLFVFADSGFLGVNGNQVSDEKAQALDFPELNGFYVTSILQNSAAERAGIRPFDYIYAVDGKTLPRHMHSGAMFAGQEAGSEVFLSVYRTGENLEIPVTLGTRAETTAVERKKWEDPFLGIYVNHYNGAGEGPRRGSVPVLVKNCSTAEAIGLQDGDRVFQIDDYPTVDWHDLGAAIDDREVGDPIRVYFYRNGELMMGEGIIRSEEETGVEPCPTPQPPVAAMPSAPNPEDISMPESEDVIEVSESDAPEGREAEGSSETVPDLNLLVFPNPSDGRFTIMLMLSEDGPVNVRIIDSRGAVIREMQMQRNAGEYMQRVDLSGLAAGAYFVQVRQNRSVAQQTVLIQ